MIYGTPGAFGVNISVTDNLGQHGTASANVEVNDVAPTLSLVGNQNVVTGESLVIPNLGTFSDPGFGASYSYCINWGDGSSDSGPVTNVVTGGRHVPTQGEFDGEHSYATSGSFDASAGFSMASSGLGVPSKSP
jgi:hypothetical protein